MIETVAYHPEHIEFSEEHEAVADLATALGVETDKLTGLPNDVLTACLMLTHYDVACAVKDFVDNPERLVSQVSPALASYISQAKHDKSEIRQYLQEERDTMIAFHASDELDADLMALRADIKQQEFNADAKIHFESVLVDVIKGAREGNQFTKSQVDQQFAVVAIDAKQIAEQFGITIAEEVIEPVAEPVQDTTNEIQESNNFAKMKITTARVGGVAAASAIVMTGIVASPANAEEVTPTPNPAQSSSSVAVQVVNPDGSIESAGTITITPNEQSSNNTVVPKPADVVQPAEVISDQPAPPAIQTTVNPLTGKTTEVTEIPDAPKQSEVRSLDQNTSLANSAIDTLQPGFKDGLVRLQKAVEQKSLNALSHSDSDVYGTKNPETGKVIELPLTGEALKDLDAQYQLLQAILANDQTYITFVNAMFDAQPLDKNKQTIIDTVAKTKFTVDGVDDLTSDQKTALLAYITYISNETNADAHKVVDKVIADYEKKKAEEERKKAETPPPAERKVAPSDRYTLLMPKIKNKQQVIDAINKYIQERAPDSPYAGMGAQIVKGAELDGTNPFMTVTIGFLESRLSTRGVAAHYNTYNMWNRDCPDGKPRVHYKDGRSGHSHSACMYDSPEQALLQTDYQGIQAAKKGHDRFTTYLKRKYLDHGITSLIPFLAIYTPSAESSDKEHAHLIASYKRELDYVYSLTGDAVKFPVKISTLKDLPKNTGSRYTTKEVADAAKPGETMFGPNDPCESLNGNVRILCSAKKYFGTRYGTADPGYAPHWEDVWGQNITSWGGHNPRGWILRNKKNSTNDFLECSGYVAVAIAGAFNVDVDHCSAGFLSDKKNFKKINPKNVKPGDLVIATPWCGGKQGGHVAIVKSYNKKTGELVTYEASASTSSEGHARVGEIRTRKIGVDFHYAARYIGPGSTTDIQS